jgi:hypothetical protein
MLLATVSQAPYCRGGVRQAIGDRTAILLLGIVMGFTILLRKVWSSAFRPMALSLGTKHCQLAMKSGKKNA